MAKLIHTMVRVLDLDRSISFYREAFGLEVADRYDLGGSCSCISRTRRRITSSS